MSQSRIWLVLFLAACLLMELPLWILALPTPATANAPNLRSHFRRGLFLPIPSAIL